MKARLCGNPECRKPFTPGRAWAKYCSRLCGDLTRVKASRKRQAKAAKKRRKGR